MPRNTQTVLYDTNSTNNNNRTAVHLSTNIIIVVGGNTVGAVQSLSINEARNVEMVDEVGTDGHIDSAPTKSTDVSGNCTRIRFDKMRIAAAFSRGFVHVKSQRVPFDIEIHDNFHDADTANKIITVLKNVWITGINYDYQVSNFIISDKMDFKAEDIYSVIKTSQNVVQTPGNGMTNDIYINQYEQEADASSVYRGALDAPGLISAFLND